MEDEDEDEIHQIHGKSTIIFLIDCSPAMHDPNNQDFTPFQASIKFIIQFLSKKIIDSKDLIGILLYGTRNTKGSDFANIYRLLELDLPNLLEIKELESYLDQEFFDEEIGTSSDTSLRDALHACQVELDKK